LGVEGTELAFREREVDPDGVGRPGMSGGSGGWDEEEEGEGEGENAVWMDEVASGDPTRLRLCAEGSNAMALERLGGGGKLSGGLLMVSLATIVSTAEAESE
jgi:hypothetical protein